MHTGPGQGWGKQGSQVVRGPAAPIRPLLSAFQGVLEESGMSSAPSSSLGLWQLLPCRPQALSQGCHHRKASARTSPRDLRTQRREGRVPEELPAPCPGLLLLPSSLLPALFCPHKVWFSASFLPGVLRLSGGLVSGSLGRKSERDWRVMGDSLQTSHFVPRDGCCCKPLLLKLELACI